MFLCATLGSAPSLAADPKEAQTLFDRGLAQMEAGRYDEACPAIEQSYKLDPLPGALFTLADCERKRGRLATAAIRYDEYIVLYATLSPERKAKQGDREKNARAQRAALTAKIAELTLVLPPKAPKGTQVMRDGTLVVEAALGVPFPVDPGEHVISAQAPDGTVTETRVTLTAGEKKAVAIDVRDAGSTAAPPPAPSTTTAKPAEGGGRNNIVVITGGAVAGAGLVVGAVLLGVGSAKSGSVSSLQEKIKQAGGCASATAGGDCADLRSAGSAKATLSNAGLWTLVGGGVVGVGTLIYALASGGPRASKSAITLTPVVGAGGGGLVVGGKF